MNLFTYKKDIVCKLHEAGYTYDFHLTGNDLFLVQEKRIIRAGDFSIRACYALNNPGDSRQSMIILGIEAIYQDLKGILISYLPDVKIITAPIIVKKLKEIISLTPEKVPAELSKRLMPKALRSQVY